jgi:transcription elongation factor GreA
MGSQDKIYLTSQGRRKLAEEYQILTKEKRPRLVERLTNARTLGDLAENSEYVQAKEELSLLEGRLEELEEILSRVVLIDQEHKSCQCVKLGCKVRVGGAGQKQTFHLVGEWEADPVNQKISHSSPLGQALLGKKVGEKVEISAPAGKITYTILAIE